MGGGANSSSSSSPNHHLNPFTAAAPPPIPSYSQIPATLQFKHSRPMSPFSAFPPPPPMEERNGAGFIPPLPPCHSTSRTLAGGEGLPPRKSHRRSNSDVTFGFSPVMAPTLERSVSGGSNFVKEEPGEGGGFKGIEAMDDVFRAYMNLDNIDVLNSFGGEDGGVEENESSRGTRKTNSSDSDGESSVKVVSSGVKRRASGGDTGRHYRSVSMDSCFMDKLNESSLLKLPPSSAKASPTNSGEGNSSACNVEFQKGQFTAAEMKRIAADEKLAEIVMADPKRVKRILANRVSAARSKERKTQYMGELEHKVQTLQTEATTLSAQLTHLQRDSMGLTNQNNELKFRLQAMEQQAQLRDALYAKLTEEIQRLKLVIGEPSRVQSGGGSRSRESNVSRMSPSPEMFQQLSISQLQEQQQMQHSKHRSYE